MTLRKPDKTCIIWVVREIAEKQPVWTRSMAIIETSSDTRSHSSILLAIAGLLVVASIYLAGTSTLSQVAG